ncbi:MAG: hypothetical protein ACK4GL_11805 [Flavobacteriales bacterium]
MQRYYPFISALLYGLTIYVNYLSTALPLNGYTPAQLSDLYPNLFVPAGVTFSIWGLIYLLLLIFIIKHAYHLWRADQQMIELFSTISPIFWLTCLLNMGWIFAWHYQFIWLSVLVMILFLITLIKIHPLVRNQASALIRLPFSIYLGWISVALIANVTTALVSINFKTMEVFFAVMVMATACVLGMLFVKKYNDLAYASVILWAFMGIFIKQLTIPSGNLTILSLACFFAVILFIFALYINLTPKAQKVTGT